MTVILDGRDLLSPFRRETRSPADMISINERCQLSGGYRSKQVNGSLTLNVDNVSE